MSPPTPHGTLIAILIGWIVSFMTNAVIARMLGLRLSNIQLESIVELGVIFSLAAMVYYMEMCILG